VRQRITLTDALSTWHAEDHRASLKRFRGTPPPGFKLKNLVEDVSPILRLIEADHRYLDQNGSSVSKGVEVLSSVTNDINCIFLHLLETPRRCDRRVVEMVAAGQINGRSANPTDSRGRGEREQVYADNRKESRMRLA
jgi:hypothetical protein